MTVKASSIQSALEAAMRDPSSGEGTGEIFMLAIPLPTYKAVADVAAKHGMSFGQFLGKALSEYISKTESSGPSDGPKLLLG